MRVIGLDSNKTVVEVKNVLDNYLLQNNELISDIGEIGQVQQPDGGFITPIPPMPTLQDTKNSKILEMTQAYETDIYGIFTSTAFDGKTEETYSCSATDQVRINGEVTTALAVLAGYSTEKISWKNVNQFECVEWHPKNMVTLGTDLHAFVTDRTNYIEALTAYINSLTTIDDVNKVT